MGCFSWYTCCAGSPRLPWHCRSVSADGDLLIGDADPYVLGQDLVVDVLDFVAGDVRLKNAILHLTQEAGAFFQSKRGRANLFWRKKPAA
jgi:hypothetical protein